MGKDGGDGGGEKKPGKGIGSFLRSVVLALLIVFIVIVAVAALVLRTDTGKEMVRERLERACGQPLEVGGARIGWPCDLVIEDVETKDFAAQGAAGFKIQELRFSPQPDFKCKLSVIRCKLNLVRRKEIWAPDCLSRIGDLYAGGLTETAKATESFRKDMLLSVEDSSIRWCESDGKELASVTGVAFSLVPVSVKNRTLFYHDLKIYSMTAEDGSACRDMGREWFSTEKNPYIEVESTGKSEAGFLKTFWEKK